MSTAKPRSLLRIEYQEAAEAYLRSLPPEHFMEATAQATQRKITLESFDLVHARRPDVQIFNELLVQYPGGRPSKPKQVVPDNMVVVWPEPIEANGSFDLLFQPVGPLLVLEYVSKHNKRKDYEDNFRIYERELKVPYYLLFYPDGQELTLYRRTRRYVSVKPNEQERCVIPELEMEVALLDGWVRYWFRGELLPLPGDLQRDLDDVRRQLREVTNKAVVLQRRADDESRRADSERLARLAAEQEAVRMRKLVEELQAKQQKGS